MEGFTYTDIFATKGLEYLIIIGFFLVLVPFWMLLTRKTASASGIQIPAKISTTIAMNLPQGIFFSRYHTWAHLEKNGEAKIGFDDLLVHLTGEVKVVFLKTQGDTVEKGESLARVHYNGNNMRIASPVSGTICSTNELIIKNPGFLKNDPYQLGWICSLKPDNWKDDTDTCFLAENATQWAVEEMDRVKEFLSLVASKKDTGTLQVVMQDGGEIAEKALTLFPQEVWIDFEKKFLS
jgi:glycine cleavage system H protein